VVVDKVRERAARGEDPLNLVLEMRVIRNSDVLLSPAFGPPDQHHCYFELISFHGTPDCTPAFGLVARPRGGLGEPPGQRVGDGVRRQHPRSHRLRNALRRRRMDHVSGLADGEPPWRREPPERERVADRMAAKAPGLDGAVQAPGVVPGQESLEEPSPVASMMRILVADADVDSRVVLGKSQPYPGTSVPSKIISMWWGRNRTPCHHPMIACRRRRGRGSGEKLEWPPSATTVKRAWTC
jgi:hypothetical protein